MINCAYFNAKINFYFFKNIVTWEIAPDEVHLISKGIDNHVPRARFLMKNIQIFNNSIIFSVTEKIFMNNIKENDYLMCFYEKGILPI